MAPPPSVVIHLLAFFSARLHSDLGPDLRAILSQELLTAQGGSSNHNAKCVLRVGMGEARGKNSETGGDLKGEILGNTKMYKVGEVK